MRRLKAEVEPEEATKILMEVPYDRAFHFYTDIGVPIGLAARSLKEFMLVIQTVDSRSIEFHILRGDFEKWIIMLGDRSLARQVGRFRKLGLKADALRARLLETVTARYEVLKASAQSA